MLCALVVLLTAAVFWPMRTHEWLDYDDDVYVTRSDPVRAGLTPASVAWAFTSFQGANWFPLTRLSWMLDAEIHGEDAAGFYATNLLLHALATGLLFLALLRMTGDAGRSAFAAAVFGVHPLHVESVAWISARKDVLSGVFFMLSLFVYARAGGGARAATRVLLLACLALGLMAKPTVVVLPFVWLLLDYWPLSRLGPPGAALRVEPARAAAAVLEKLPAFALVAVASVLTVLAQRSGGALVGDDVLPFSARAANALESYVAYLAKAFAPHDLAVFYPHPAGGMGAGALAACALLLAVTAAAFALRRRAPALLVGWLWYLGALVPVIGLVQVGSQAMADRYTYLPLVGIALALAWGVPALLPTWRGRDAALGAVAVAAVAVMAWTTSLQLRHWRSSEALFTHALAVTRDNHIAHAHLGQALLDEGRPALAIEHWREAVRIRPDFDTAANNLAWLLATSPDPAVRDPEEALRYARLAEEAGAPDDPAILDTLAAAHAAAGRFGAARDLLRRAVRLAVADGDEDLARDLRARLALYRAGRPYVQPARPPAATR